MEKWVGYSGTNRGGGGVGKTVGKTGKVGGKAEFCTGGMGVRKKCTEKCTGFTRSFARRFAHVFHNLGVFEGSDGKNW